MAERGSVTLTLQSSSPGHRFGVNVVRSCPESDQLYTAGRDGTVRCWSAGASSQPVLKQTLDEHTEWVNGIAIIQPGVLASCSSDRTVKVWSVSSHSPGTTQVQADTLGHHGDYAKAIVFAPQRGLLASAGFDCRLMLWDPQRAAPIAASVQPAQSEVGAVHQHSIYALDCNAEGTLLATGSVDTDVRLWDPRDLRSSLRLQGHTDIIRSVILCEDGRRALSCSSDATVRVWHLGEQRCEQVLEHHSASVLSLCVHASHVLSGDARGEVRISHLSSGTSALLCRASAHAVLSLHVQPAHERLWVSSTASTLHSWDLRKLVVPAAGFGAASTADTRAGADHSSAAEVPLLRDPAMSIRGSAGIKRCAPRRMHAASLTPRDSARDRTSLEIDCTLYPCTLIGAADL